MLQQPCTVLPLATFSGVHSPCPKTAQRQAPTTAIEAAPSTQA